MVHLLLMSSYYTFVSFVLCPFWSFEKIIILYRWRNCRQNFFLSSKNMVRVSYLFTRSLLFWLSVYTHFWDLKEIIILFLSSIKKYSWAWLFENCWSIVLVVYVYLWCCIHYHGSNYIYLCVGFRVVWKH